MVNQVLHTVWCNITGEAAGEIWHWSLLGGKGLTCSALAGCSSLTQRSQWSKISRSKWWTTICWAETTWSGRPRSTWSRGCCRVTMPTAACPKPTAREYKHSRASPSFVVPRSYGLVWRFDLRSGDHQWRDSEKPLKILERWCEHKGKKMRFFRSKSNSPGRIVIEDRVYTLEEFGQPTS